MVTRVIDKTKPITSFNLKFPVNFSVALPISKKEQLVKIYSKDHRLKGFPKRIKRKFLHDFFDVENENELLKRNRNIKKKSRELKQEILDETGLDIGEFPNWLKETVDKMIEEENNKNNKEDKKNKNNEK